MPSKNHDKKNNQQIDILLPYDHFDTDNLIHICDDLSNQIHQNFTLKLLIDPVQEKNLVDILQQYPKIKHEIHKTDLYKTVDLDYLAIANSDKKVLNLHFSESTLKLQQMTKIKTTGQMLQELAKHATAEYIITIDPYTRLLNNHLSTLLDIESSTQLSVTNNMIKADLYQDLYNDFLILNNTALYHAKVNNNPDNLVTNQANDYVHNQLSNLSVFLMKKSFFDTLLNSPQIDKFSYFGLYWQTMFMAMQSDYRHIHKNTSYLEIRRYIHHYTYNPAGLDFKTELSQVFANNAGVVKTLPTHTGVLKSEPFFENRYDLLDEKYYQQVPKYNHDLDPAVYNNVLVTIGIPFYNEEKRARACLESIVNQTYKNLEIICINDVSTDGTIDILNEYAEKDPRIKVMSHETSRGFASRNTAIENATGEYIHFVDGDDVLALNTIEKCLDVFHKHPETEVVNYPVLSYAYVRPAMNYLLLMPNVPGMPDLHFSKLNDFPDFLQNLAIYRNLYRLSTLKKHNFHFTNAIGEDVLLNLQLYSNEVKSYYLNTPLYYYILKKQSAVTSNIKERDLPGIYHLDQIDMNNFSPEIRKSIHATYFWALHDIATKSITAPVHKRNFSEADKQLLLRYNSELYTYLKRPELQEYVTHYLCSILDVRYKDPAFYFAIYARYFTPEEFITYAKHFIELINSDLDTIDITDISDIFPDGFSQAKTVAQITKLHRQMVEHEQVYQELEKENIHKIAILDHKLKHLFFKKRLEILLNQS